MHLLLTHKLLAHIYYVKVEGWTTQYPKLSKICPQRLFVPHRTLSHRRQGLLSHRGQGLPQRLTLSPKPISFIAHLISRGSQTTCNRNFGYHDSCTHWIGFKGLLCQILDLWKDSNLSLNSKASSWIQTYLIWIQIVLGLDFKNLDLNHWSKVQILIFETFKSWFELQNPLNQFKSTVK
jgi:hypothetical protein